MGKRIKDMKGLRIGKLEVLRDSGKRDTSGRVLWKCKCDCGNTVSVIGSSLRRGQTNSCGCLQRKATMKRVYELHNERIGKKYNKLTVIKVHRDKGRTFYKCVCECGDVVSVRADGVVRGHAKSCGCWNMEVINSKVGEDHPSYDFNITDEEREKGRFLYSIELTNWRKEVFESDDYTCQCCSVRGGATLHAHHLNGYHWDKDNRFNPNNGVTLCENCHITFHNIYGRKNNTKVQFEEFIASKELTKLNKHSI